MTSLKNSAAWKALEGHHRKISDVHMRDLFSEDPDRFNRFSLGSGKLFLDYSKNRITEETLKLLFDLARSADVEGWRERMFSGDAVNTTEGRAALHVALRDPGTSSFSVDGEDVVSAIKAARAKMRRISEDVRSGDWTGATGKPIRSVVSFGTGGSHLGPQLVTEALASYATGGPDVHFVSNIDGAQITRTLRGLSAEETLFIVVSKTFTTEETLTNARTARKWLTDALGDTDVAKHFVTDVAKHFVAVTANPKAASKFGIAEENTIEFWDWVGGRYSLWSGVGLAIALSVGMDRFEELLAGAHDMDRHFRNAPMEDNIPVILAVIGIWNINFLGAAALAVLPYDEGLKFLPVFLQQLEMESNGKSVTHDGQSVDVLTAPFVFGEPGTNGQHTFYQAIHQGPRLIASDFIIPVESHHPTGDHHQRLLANFLAQSEALMAGRTEEKTRQLLQGKGASVDELEREVAHHVFEGNKPSNAILLYRVDPFSLGQLIALYEHKVFTEAVIWGINPFDQWGVELGKGLEALILPQLSGDADLAGHDASTRGLINRINASKTLKL